MEIYRPTSTGTTTLAVVCRDGVVFGADTRATAGTFISHKRVKKIHALDEHLAMTISGVFADAQSVLEMLKVNVALYRISAKKPIPVKSAARLTANILFGSRLFPFGMQAIIGGVDDSGPHVFVLDPLGSVTEEKYSSTGSGSPIALGILEDGYRDDMTVKEAVPLVVRSVHSAMKRDVGSGDDFDVMVVTKDGYKELSQAEKERYLKGGR
jgi:proteasome beta subunit